MIIHELWHDEIDESGITKRIYYHCLVEIDGVKEWYYFGTDPAEKPPTQDYPIKESPYIQIPQGLDNLDKQEADGLLYDMGLMIGLRREGLTSP
jgi:hypothetical protein